MKLKNLIWKTANLKKTNLIKVAWLEKETQKSCPTWCCERLQNCFSGSVGTITKSWSGTEFNRSSSCFTCLDFGLLISESEKNNNNTFQYHEYFWFKAVGIN